MQSALSRTESAAKIVSKHYGDGFILKVPKLLYSKAWQQYKTGDAFRSESWASFFLSKTPIHATQGGEFVFFFLTSWKMLVPEPRCSIKKNGPAHRVQGPDYRSSQQSVAASGSEFTYSTASVRWIHSSLNPFSYKRRKKPLELCWSRERCCPLTGVCSILSQLEQRHLLRGLGRWGWRPW